jgi:hypothetical protein
MIVVVSAIKPGVALLNPDGRPSYFCVSKYRPPRANGVFVAVLKQDVPLGSTHCTKLNPKSSQGPPVGVVMDCPSEKPLPRVACDPDVFWVMISAHALPEKHKAITPTK